MPKEGVQVMWTNVTGVKLSDYLKSDMNLTRICAQNDDPLEVNET
jgi:hypothetical protein